MINQTNLPNMFPERLTSHSTRHAEKMILIFADMSKQHAVAGKLSELERYFDKEEEWGTSFDWVQLHSGHLFTHAVPEQYKAAGIEIDQRTNEYLDQAIALCKKHGKKVCYMVGDYRPLDRVLKAFPEMRNLNNGLFWQFVYDMTDALLKRFPDLDELGTYLFESKNLVYCDNFFKPFNYGIDFNDENIDNDPEGMKKAEEQSFPYLSFGDHIRMLLMSISKACKDNGRTFSLLTHTWYPYQEDLLCDALKDWPEELPILLEHNYTTGDFNPSLPQPKMIAKFPQMKHSIVFCCGMEYYGLGIVPCCFPAEIQARFNAALDASPNLCRVTMRPLWDGYSALDSPNEVNVYSLCKMADHPDVNTDDLWHTWIENRYGITDLEKQDKLATALHRGYQVVDKVGFEFGIRCNNHSHLQSFRNIESRIHNYGKALCKWVPTPENRQLVYDLLIDPTRKILRLHKEIHDDADYRIRQAQQALGELQADLRPEDYQDLQKRFSIQQEWVILHGLEYDAYLRVLVERKHPDADNEQKAQKDIETLKSEIAAIRSGRKEDNYLYSLNWLDEFIVDEQEEMSKAKASRLV